VELYANAGLPYDFDMLSQLDIQGIGLYRTEIAFMVRQSYPDIVTQVDLYKQAMAAVEPKPVLFRILDIGGDKNLPYMSDNLDNNPLMGWRAVRLMLDQPGLLRQQVRALMMAAQGRPLHVMLPMVTEVAELDSVRHLIDLEQKRLYDRRIPLPQPLKLGVVLEVPALVWQLPNLLRRIDFLAVGTNDLFQFSFAADRGNHRVAERYDPLAPAFLKMLHNIIVQTDAASVPLWLCGELVSNPVDFVAMIALGVRKISVSCTALARLRAIIPKINVAPIAELIQTNLDAPDHSLRSKILGLLQDMQSI
jgi:phosphotransferase system enzyme I (PtsP)